VSGIDQLCDNEGTLELGHVLLLRQSGDHRGFADSVSEE
jgi:hypothetical protein